MFESNSPPWTLDPASVPPEPVSAPVPLPDVSPSLVVLCWGSGRAAPKEASESNAIRFKIFIVISPKLIDVMLSLGSDAQLHNICERNKWDQGWCLTYTIERLYPNCRRHGDDTRICTFTKCIIHMI